MGRIERKETKKMKCFRSIREEKKMNKHRSDRFEGGKLRYGALLALNYTCKINRLMGPRSSMIHSALERFET